MAKRKKTEIVQFKVRLREALRQQLESAAKAQERSLNSEIVTRLEQSIAQASQDQFKSEIVGHLEQVQASQYLLIQMAEAWLNLAEQQGDRVRAESMSKNAARLLEMAKEKSSRTLRDEKRKARTTNATSERAQSASKVGGKP
jgi:hypothetical protein